MKFSLKITIIALSIPLLFSFASLTKAQVPNSIDGVEVNVDPENPAPGQNVTVSVESYNTDLNSASIVWIVDGKNYKQGSGIKSINISAPQIGKKTNIVIAIMTVEGREVKKSLNIKSGSVDIIWETDGYAPPFYKGKNSFAYQNTIKVTAIPHLSENGTSEIDPSTLIYNWKNNDKAIQDQSGYGKQTISIKDDLPKTLNIEVNVETKNGSQKGISSISLTPDNPSILFYEDNPYYGTLYNNALIDRFDMNNQEVNILAAPYGFNNVYNQENPLNYLWSINDLENPDLSKNQTVTLRTKEGQVGSSRISLNIRNEDNILQGARNVLDIFFGKSFSDNNSSTL